MRIADIDAACADSDERCVTAAAEHRSAGCKSKLLRCLFGQLTCLVGGLYDGGKVLFIDLVHSAKRIRPALVTVACIINERCEGRVLGHDEIARASAHKVVLDIKPILDLVENLRLMVLHPLVFPYGVFDA